MKQIRFSSMIVLSLLVGAMTLSACGSSGAAKKPKGIVLQEGDPATVTHADGFTTIEFPATLTAEQRAFYDTDFLGYMLKSNGPISTDGRQYDTYNIYYYLHNSREWLHQGIYENAYEMKVADIKTIKIADYRQRLREFNEKMPLLNNSKEKKSDSGYQDEILFGNNYYLFIEIVMRDR
jgi:hypothetical protein